MTFTCHLQNDMRDAPAHGKVVSCACKIGVHFWVPTQAYLQPSSDALDDAILNEQVRFEELVMFDYGATLQCKRVYCLLVVAVIGAHMEPACHMQHHAKGVNLQPERVVALCTNWIARRRAYNLTSTRRIWAEGTEVASACLVNHLDKDWHVSRMHRAVRSKRN